MTKSLQLFLLTIVVFTSLNITSVFCIENDLRILGGVGAPYGFGGLNISYAINNRFELSFGLGLADSIVSGIDLYPMLFGFKYFPPSAYWNPNIVQYMSIYYGAVGILIQEYFMNWQPPTYSVLNGACLGFGYYLFIDTSIINFIPLIPEKIIVDIGFNYLIPTQTIPTALESTFQIVNYYIAAGLSFNFEFKIPELPNLFFFLED